MQKPAFRPITGSTPPTPPSQSLPLSEENLRQLAPATSTARTATIQILAEFPFDPRTDLSRSVRLNEISLCDSNADDHWSEAPSKSSSLEYEEGSILTSHEPIPGLGDLVSYSRPSTPERFPALAELRRPHSAPQISRKHNG